MTGAEKVAKVRMKTHKGKKNKTKQENHGCESRRLKERVDIAGRRTSLHFAFLNVIKLNVSMVGECKMAFEGCCGTK